jgi:DNA-directed RNA polymerase subunit alpha
VRSRNSLQKENIHTVRDLVQRTEQQMLSIDNFGKKSLQEISDFLAGHGLHFGQELEQGEDGTLWWVIGDTPPAEGETMDENAGDGAGREL